MRLSSHQHSEEPDVNLTPMIDVVFLLLLFFMISTSFVRESSLKVDLPEATGKPIENEEGKPIDIVIFSDGKLNINDVVLDNPTSEKIISALKKSVGNNPDPHIIISADADAEYQRIVTAMDVSRQLGYTRLTLATRQSQ